MGVQRNRRIAQSSFHVPVADVFRAVFETNDRSYERVASSFNVGDISVAELAITECLADGGHVDPEAALLHDDVRPDVINELLFSDDLAWTFGEIDQNIERPTAKRKRDTVAPQHPLATRKLKPTQSQRSVACCRDGLLDFMSNRGGELAHGSDAVGIRQRHLYLAILPLAT